MDGYSRLLFIIPSHLFSEVNLIVVYATSNNYQCLWEDGCVKSQNCLTFYKKWIVNEYTLYGLMNTKTTYK